MGTGCNGSGLEFQPAGVRGVVGNFDGGRIMSDAGGLLLREVERGSRIIEQFAACFVDHRHPLLIEHTAREGARWMTWCMTSVSPMSEWETFLNVVVTFP